MAEYIEREALLRDIEHHHVSDGKFQHWILAQPAVDVAPVVHTKWAHIGGDEWCCPACGFVLTTEGSWEKPAQKYCENCGAKMDGGPYE